MKPLLYILSVYMMLLAVFPCCLVDDCPDDNIEQVASHQDDEEESGNCSPFFSCEGCAFASAASDPLTYSLDKIFVKPAYTGFTPPFIPDTSFDFWQPPQLA